VAGWNGSKVVGVDMGAPHAAEALRSPDLARRYRG
jgi:hypothetical protein